MLQVGNKIFLPEIKFRQIFNQDAFCLFWIGLEIGRGDSQSSFRRFILEGLPNENWLDTPTMSGYNSECCFGL